MRGTNKRYQRCAVAVLAMILVATLFAGCSKQRADIAKKKATSNMQTAKRYEADKFDESKAKYEQADSSLKSANSSFDGQQFAPALTQAKDAVRLSEETLAAVRPRFAAKQIEGARKAMEIAGINDGKKENPDLYDKAQKRFDDAVQKNAKQKYDDSIDLATETINNVEQLLAGLKNSASNSLKELDARVSELKEAKADTFLPNAVIKGTQSVDQITSRIEHDRDYKQAIIMARAAIADTQANITETKKRHSNQELQMLEAKISEAVAEEAPIYAPDELRTTQESFEEILKSHYENQFDTALAEAKLLEPKVVTLITMTRIEATKDKLNTVEKSIAGLKAQAVEQYLPGRIQVMENLLKEGWDFFNNNAFDMAKDKANQALVEQDRIVASFDALTEKSIVDATQAFNTARQTYDKMVAIFAAAAPQTPTDQQVDTRRQVETSNLGAQLASADARLKAANESRSAKGFKKAIEDAKEVQGVSDNVISTTFRIVAQHSLIEIQNEISQLERAGARKEAPKQLDQVQALVTETQKLITENQNREAADRAAKTRAYLENVKQELARRATEEKGIGEELMHRVGGSSSPSPVGGERPKPQPLRPTTPTPKAPGGSDLNNKEMMFGDDLAALSRPEPIVVAQLPAVGNTIQSTGGTGVYGAIDNRSLPSGTFMNDSHVVQRNPVPVPGSPTGAIIGTRPEPVVVTRDEAGGASGTMSGYEAPTGPGPFIANKGLPKAKAPAGSPVASVDTTPDPATDGAGYIAAVQKRVQTIMADEQRLRDIRRFQPLSVTQARAKLNESSARLVAQDYLAATRAAEEAERIILDAELHAAKAVAEENLKQAADRVNVAEASGALTFAPAQLTEAIRLYEQAETFLKNGDYNAARDTSSQAVVAADDARLYNVHKAQDLASLSIRYGGWKFSSPQLTNAEQMAAVGESMLTNPDTAPQGQEIAKQAVTEAQLALDHARDYTFQERLDNIYKALNTALRAGANYFNVQEVKRLIAEIAVARDEYCTRNFDAVELKLKDIEARLARVIETTPLVLEENLVECTNKLNALVLAGAENHMAQEVDDVKSLMNRSVIDFRKHDYASSYSNIRNAMKLVDRIEDRLQEQVYFDAVTELFAQMDVAFHDFTRVIDTNRSFMKKLVVNPNGQTAAIELAGPMSPNAFKDRMTDIYLRAIHLKPPKSQEGLHQEVLTAIKYAKVSSENFQRLYIMDQLSKPAAYEIIDTAYNQIERAKEMRSDLQVRLIDPEARHQVIRAEKIVNY